MGQRVPAILRNRRSIGLQRSFDVAGRQQNIAPIHVRAYEIRCHSNGGVVTPQRLLEFARVLNDIAFLDQAQRVLLGIRRVADLPEVHPAHVVTLHEAHVGTRQEIIWRQVALPLLW